MSEVNIATDNLAQRIAELVEMERRSGSMEVITPLYVSRMLNVPIEEVEAAGVPLNLYVSLR